MIKPLHHQFRAELSFLNLNYRCARTTTTMPKAAKAIFYQNFSFRSGARTLSFSSKILIFHFSSIAREKEKELWFYMLLLPRVRYVSLITISLFIRQRLIPLLRNNEISHLHLNWIYAQIFAAKIFNYFPRIIHRRLSHGF